MQVHDTFQMQSRPESSPIAMRALQAFLWLVAQACIVYDEAKKHWITQWLWRHAQSTYKFGRRWVLGWADSRQDGIPSNMVIAICGKKGSGKDTSAAKIVKCMWELEGHWYKHRTFAEPLKRVVQLLTNCSSSKLHTHEGKESVFPNAFHPEQETYRDILKSIGKATRRFLANWIDQQWHRELRTSHFLKLPNCWVLSDLRLQDELKWVRSLAPTNSTATRVIVIRIESPRFDMKVDTDVSETSVDEFAKNEIDFTIYNTTWDDNQKNLEKQCKLICETILHSKQ